MVPHRERERFLAEQAEKFGEPILTFSLAQQWEGPPLEAKLVFLLVSATSLHLVAVPTDPSMFGVPLKLKEEPKAPVPRSFLKSEVTFGAKTYAHWWKQLTAPRDVIEVTTKTDSGTAVWWFAAVSPAERFLNEWKTAWQ